MSKRGLLSGSTLASRFPTVMRLLGSAAADDQRDPGDEDRETPEDPPAEDPPADDPPADDPPADDPPAHEDDEAGANASVAAVELAGEQRVQLLSAFERDANRLVSAERDRCISVFTSDAGRRNPDGCAAVLRDTNMDATKASAFMATFGGNGRTDARDRLRGDASTRVQTGAGKDGTATGGDAKAAHRERMKNRNKTVKGGKTVNSDQAAPPAAD